MNRFRLTLPAIFALAVLLSGCGALKIHPDPPQETIKAAPAGRQIYKAAVMLSQAPETPFGRRMGGRFLDALIGAIGKESARIELLTPAEKDFPSFMQALRPAGGTDPLGAMEAARLQGFQGVILATVNGLGTQTRRWGLLWFSRTTYFLTFSVTVDLYDPFTGARIVSRVQETELKIDSDDYESFQEEGLAEIDAVDKSLADTARQFGKQVAGQLVKQPWKASVVSVQPGAVRLAVDPGAGLEPDQKMVIYEARRVLENRFGQKFIVPGARIAEARIARVNGGGVEALLEEDADVQPGDLAVSIP